jgi:hypothetical protein
MTLRREQEDLYRKTMDEMKRQIDDVDIQIEEEITALKARLAELQDTKKSLMSAYRGMAKLLGEDGEVDLDEGRSGAASFKSA